MRSHRNKNASVYIGILFSFVVLATLGSTIYAWIAGVTDITLTILMVSTSLSFILFMSVYYLWRRKTFVATDDIIPSTSEIQQVSERILKRGTVNYDIDGTVVYISRWLLESGFKQYLGKEIEAIGLNMHDKEVQVQEIENRIFQFIFYYKTKTIVVLEITEQEHQKEYIKSRQPVVITVEKSFSQQLKQEEIALLKANIEINEVIEQWAEKSGAIAIFGQSTSQPTLIIGTWFSIQDQLLDESLTNEIEAQLGDELSEVSISIGAASGSDDFSTLLVQSNKAVKTAINRGGNQTVAISPDGEVSYIGASKIETQSDEKSEIVLFAEKFLGQLKTHKEIFITAHRLADIDAYASVLTTAKLLKDMSLDVYIVLDEYDQYTKQVHKSLSQDWKGWFISESEAISKKTKRSGAIILDVSDVDRTQASKLIYDISPDSVYIIDHHRIGGKVEVATDDTVFIDTTASSTTAILTEMIIGTNNEEIFDPKIATLLLAGVYLDTNELTRNTSARTHDVISQLIKAGADNEQASSSLQTSIEDIPLITAALNSSVKLGRKTLISVMPENKILNDTDVSSLADMLLEYKGIDAGFVLARIKGNKYKLSARSNEKINVQLVAEALNGGGHFNSSAATWKRADIDYVKLEAKVKKTITKVLKSK